VRVQKGLNTTGLRVDYQIDRKILRMRSSYNTEHTRRNIFKLHYSTVRINDFDREQIESELLSRDREEDRKSARYCLARGWRKIKRTAFA
jgi:hypothetical protein